MYGDVVAYLQATQRCSRGRAYWVLRRCGERRRQELIREARLWQTGSATTFATRDDFVGSPTRRPLFD